MANKVNGPGVICVKGTLTDEGTECQALRSVDGEFFTLLGDLKGFRNGDEVAVCGMIADVSFCMQGSTIVVSWIGEASSRAADDHAVQKLAAPRRKEGSPIVVGGGGSVIISFNSASHYQPTGRPNEFSHPTDEVHAGYLYNRNHVAQNLTPQMAGKNCTLTIACLDATGLDSPIIIDSRPGGPLKIRFRESDYPYDSGKQVRFSPDRVFTSIQIRDNSSAAQPLVMLADPAGHVEIVNNLP